MLWQVEMHRVHTVIGLYIAIITIRLVTSGRLQNAWQALNTHGEKAAAAPSPSHAPTPKTPAPQSFPKGVA